MNGERVLADNVVVVLNRTQDIVNIGGTVRAMMNMGLERLRLVQPDTFDAYRIAGIAHGSEWLLDRIEFFDTLEAATADAGLIVGTTARRRRAAFVWDQPRTAAPAILTAAAETENPVCLVFGREDTGLQNEDLDRCDRLVVIPTTARHRSLNIAQAVLLLTWELFMAARELPDLPQPKRRSRPATSAELALYFEDQEHALDTIEFFKSRNAPMIMRTLRAFTRKARPSEREVKLLRAIAIEVRKFFERKG